MKSIMQEASSVVKAIEKGWENAGRPKEFSVKIFEEPKKNFIGITLQSAKVGIFFDEKVSFTHEEDEKVPVQKKREAPQKLTSKKEYAQEHKAEKVRSQPKIKTIPMPQPAKQQAIKEVKPQKIVWTQEMVEFAHQWITHVLHTLNLFDIQFTAQPQQYELLVNFNRPLLENNEKEQQLLRSFSLLLIQTLRHNFKRPLRGFKILMNSSL